MIHEKQYLCLVAKGFISETATKLDELEDPNDLPEAINQVVGQTFTFGVYFQTEHIVYGTDIYKSALHLTDGQDNNELLSTPFTKREEDAPDISSSTMKVCSKQVMFGEDELVGV
ncbi:hypothetical protein DY000_02016351 [Brassica cretica]|uniref:Uncharacterized protein n=1 Tax=Brassica cretica TaxID=69181 RepID=A0ABQ7CVM9_BRACR|nr:hypothetical protein DY000_02016351 [Brassica cretica]